MKRTLVILVAAAMLLGALSLTAQEEKFSISGVTYMKYLWGNQRFDGSLYNFTSVPGEGWGDNGQGTEIELLFFGKPSKYLEVSGRIHSRFSQNQWTNFGGFGGNPDADCIGGDCGEFDPRSNQYVKLRGLTLRVTPGWKYADAITIGATDLGMFDPFTIGKIRYIDRDNAAAILFQGKLGDVKYDFIRVSSPRLWAGPEYNTGQYTTQDSIYGLQGKWEGSMVDVTGIVSIARDVEIDGTDTDPDDGRDLDTRYSNDVYGLKVGVRPTDTIDLRAAIYTSDSDSNPLYTPTGFFGISGFSPVPAGEMSDQAWKLNADFMEIGGTTFAVQFEYFDFGADYVSLMAARRESDTLLTEGFDATFAYPGPSNASFGVFGGNETRIGYAGWIGESQQVVTINVDNEFTDFDEPWAESATGWKGFTIIPKFEVGDWRFAAEYTYIDYNTNWQAWGDDTRPIDNTVYPTMELDTGVGRNFRSAYAPFQDQETNIFVIKTDTVLPIANGVDFFAKIKLIDEKDKRLNDARYLPYVGGDCPGGGVECGGVARNYSPGNSTSSIYFNPPVITVNGITGYQWKPFDDISDDDRDMDYKMFQVGAGYQFTDLLYGSLTYEFYDVDLEDGNTAHQAYQLHEMTSGKHEKNRVIVRLRYPIGGAECGLNYVYAFGDFTPDFGDGFVVQYASADQAASVGVPVGSPGFAGRFGGWNSLETRSFDHQALKAYIKVRF
jgi:hypothetical protein